MRHFIQAWVILLSCHGFAQTNPTSIAGAAASNQNGIVLEWTVGQTVSHSATNTGGSVIHGLHQPAEIVQEVLSTLEKSTPTINIYPNPVVSRLKINSEMVGEAVELYDLKGTMLLSKSIDHALIELDLSHLGSGTYLLKIISKQEIHQYKILKN